MKLHARHFISLALCLQLPVNASFASTPKALTTATIGEVRSSSVNQLLKSSTSQTSSDARTALAQGKAFLRRASTDQALVALEKALELAKQNNDENTAAAAHDALGDLYLRQGQYAAARDHYQSAYTAFRSESDPYNANLMLAKIGEANFKEGKKTEALAAYNQMDARKPETNAVKVVGSARAKVNKGRNLFDRVKNIANATPSTSTASSVTSVATDAAGEVKRGFDLYRQFIIYATHEIGLGRIDYSNYELESARQHFENALAAAGGGDLPIIGKFGQTRRFRVAARTSLGDVALRQSRYGDAIKFYTDAAAGAQNDGRLDLMWPAQRGLGRSRLLMAAQETDQTKAAKLREDAIASYREALKTIETLRAGSLRADDARSSFLATTAVVFDESASALAEMALTASGKQGGTVDGRALEYATEGFHIVEQGRARALLDMLAESAAVISEGVAPELIKSKQDNLARQQEIAGILTGVNLNNEEPPKPVGELEAELDRLSTEYDQIENQIRVANPRYSALTAPQPLSLAEAQTQVLDDKTILLEYSLGGENSYLWAVAPKEVALYKLPKRETLDKMAIETRAQLIPAQLRRQLVGINVADASAQPQRGLNLGGQAAAATSSPASSSGAAGAYASAANALYKAAVEPAAAMFAAKRLLIVADGALNYVPFEALTTSAPTANTTYDALPYLVKTNEVIYAPSATVVAVIRQQTTKTPVGGGLLLVADPVFDGSDPRARAKTTTAGDGGGANAGNTAAAARGLALGSALTDITSGASQTANAAANGGFKLARLDGTRLEAQQISQLARTAGKTSNLWLDLEASETNIKTRDLKGYRVLHVATHGLLDADRPQFSGLVLSLVGDNGAGDDGFLRADEVYNLRLGAPLVMLSACETGLGREKRGEGVIGLSRAFMYAGAPTVGVSLWSVADRSTAELMTDFYRRLLAKTGALPPSAALRAAQQNMIAGKKYSAPFYWAPFVLNGDWR